MKRFARSMVGVTLLEIMLVLAIAAMIIVMSVRYYQSANTSQQANAFLSQVQAITAAMNSMSQSTGNFSGLTQASITGFLPTNGLIAPWGGSAMSVAGNSAGFSITGITIPAGVCELVTRQLTASANYQMSGCNGVTYIFSP